ncbi:MAG: hypothetical protein ACXV8O_01570 [Methylobacter sp.]
MPALLIPDMTYLTTKQLREKKYLWRMVANRKTGEAYTDAMRRAHEYRDKINERENPTAMETDK